jgi:pimeloyl-ACP methyl ester carboxylesterase
LAQAAVTQITLDVRGVSVVVRQAGDGPPLFYLHDELSTGWNPFLDLLAERFHVVAPEIPGFGDTALPPWVETIDDVAFLIADIADMVGSGAPIMAVGTSLGGWLSLEAGLRGAPFSRIAAIGSPGAYLPGDPPADYFFMTPEERLGLLFNSPSAAPEISEDHSVRNQAMTARLVWQPRYVSPKLEHRIHRITAPTLSPGEATTDSSLRPMAKGWSTTSRPERSPWCLTPAILPHWISLTRPPRLSWTS